MLQRPELLNSSVMDRLMLSCTERVSALHVILAPAKIIKSMIGMVTNLKVDNDPRSLPLSIWSDNWLTPLIYPHGLKKCLSVVFIFFLLSTDAISTR